MNQDPQGATAGAERPKYVRRKYLIDPSTQLRFGFGLLFVLLCGVAGAVGLWIISSRISLDGAWGQAPDPADSARLTWWINGAYFLFAAATMLTISVRFSHRFIGPGRVIAHALSRMCEGDFSARTQLRRKDKLKDVAQAAGRLAGVLKEKEAWLGLFASNLEDAVARGDLELVREYSIQLLSYLDGKTHAVEPATPSSVEYSGHEKIAS